MSDEPRSDELPSGRGDDGCGDDRRGADCEVHGEPERQRWRPGGFIERVGAALVAPRHVLRSSDEAGADGKTAGDAAALLGL
ncbi:MAG: hypothetical protein AAGC55_30015, partial [Myxococcota bacterium]